MDILLKTRPFRVLLTVLILLLHSVFLLGQEASEVEFEPIDSDSCATCHEETEHEGARLEELSHSAHEGLGCLDCHQDRATFPHQEIPKWQVGCKGCRDCHEGASEEYKAHGRYEVGDCEDMPQCKDCHGSHDILPSNVKRSKTHPVNLPQTCGGCHENIDLVKKYDLIIDHPIALYESSVHGQASKGGIYVAATCNDCHSTGGTAHRILSPGHPESSINHFNIPKTCGKCHRGIENDFWDGIHGKLVKRGETDAPVCTDCHGEHGIISPRDPMSPVSRARVAEQTCSPCHESAVLNQKYGLTPGRLTTFIDSYHGLKSKAGDTHVANCASCHGVHRILPSGDPTSTINPRNLQITCGECHPHISEKMAATPIHGMSGEGLQTTVADWVEKIYVVAIVVIIGLMVLHWLLDLWRHLTRLFRKRPQIRRLYLNEVWQHAFLMVSFIALVISGFALRYNESWISTLFFGWEGGFGLRGLVHRFAAVLFLVTVIWHALYIGISSRGRKQLLDMMPRKRDFTDFWHQILYNLRRRKERPQHGRFSYVEKAEYWALVWGTVVMIVTGFLLWFDNWFIRFLPKGFLDVSLVIHYWEAWLATLAILVWHLYSTVFSPAVYPMNPSWLTGMMPEEMYKHEHPAYFEQAKKDTEAHAKRELEWTKPGEPEEEGERPGD